MKALIQRVLNAKVTVNDELVSNIGQGLCIFIGISNTDTVKDMEFITMLTQFDRKRINSTLIKSAIGPIYFLRIMRARKLLSLKLFNDETNKRWKRNVVDADFELLCVSQFTLYNTWKGNKPDFHLAMPGERSKEFYEQFLQLLRNQYKPEKVKDGVFGAYMQVSIQNDGPVTLEIESPPISEKSKTKDKSKQAISEIESDET